MKDSLHVADITIVGSGMACSATLIALFEQLINDNDGSRPPVRITVIERYPELWKGIPYGNRSSVNALTITTINDFFTDDQERADFFNWFLPNKNQLLKTYKKLGGTTAINWLKDNEHALDTGDLYHVYLPRFIVGEYTAQRLNNLRSKIETEGSAVINTIRGNVTAIKQKDVLKTILIEQDGHQLNVLTKKIVLAIGSAPEKKLTDTFDHQSGVLYINNLHQKNLEETAGDIYMKLVSSAPGEKNILIVGSNASSIELLYLLKNTENLYNNIDGITILSLGGKLPGHITYEHYPHNVTANLDTLGKEGHYNVDQLAEAAAQDIRKVVVNAVSVPDIDKIMGQTIKMLQPLNEHSKKLFYGIYGVQLARIFRRSGTDHKKASDALLQNGKLNLIKGIYNGLVYNSDGTTTLSYKGETGTISSITRSFKVVVNCTGSEYLVSSSSALIKDLIENNGLKVNLSGKAFEVHDNLEATPGIYVIGPLAGGNFNKLLYFWHLENASRIIYLSKYLAKELLR